MKRLLLLIASLTLAGCVRPGDHAIPPTCVWEEEDSRLLNLTKSSDRRHLHFDAVTAEDVSIRWTDQNVGMNRHHQEPGLARWKSSVVGVAVGSLWSILIEWFRLNSGHLSYRMNRIPARRHWELLFISLVAVFALATLIRSRVNLSHRSQTSQKLS